jgi:hypothetical protein
MLIRKFFRLNNVKKGYQRLYFWAIRVIVNPCGVCSLPSGASSGGAYRGNKILGADQNRRYCPAVVVGNYRD